VILVFRNPFVRLIFLITFLQPECYKGFSIFLFSYHFLSLIFLVFEFWKENKNERILSFSFEDLNLFSQFSIIKEKTHKKSYLEK